MNHQTVIMWFRHDLRLDDNPAVSAAVATGAAVVPVYVWAPGDDAPWAPGGASSWWLHQSLRSLQESLRGHGSRLVIRHGSAADVLVSLARETGAEAVFWNGRHEPAARAQETECSRRLGLERIKVIAFASCLLHEPEELRTVQGGPFQVFTPFWRRLESLDLPVAPVDAPRVIASPGHLPASLSLADLGLEPKPYWAADMRASWCPGEAGASALLDRFLEEAVESYPQGRDCPDLAGTSRLSPHLHFGEISVQRILYRLAGFRAQLGAKEARKLSEGIEAWKRQIVWREFAYHLLHHYPQTTDRPLRVKFEAFPWRNDARALRCWQKGLTGYPIVDAGMRELWTTGWMHNRVRMIAASFLVKDLLIPWQEGARWFWDTLVDADLANNTLGWQWVAGCGADAAPYFRIFNPVSQGEKFDPRGGYVRRWVPELACLPDKWIHRPWEAAPAELKSAGIGIGQSYPKPIADHAAARQRALAALARCGK